MISQETIAHLELVQGVVSRMASNSLAVKSLAVTIVAAVSAIAAQAGSATAPTAGMNAGPATWLLPALSLVPLGLLWLMDAYYLSIERAFRCLYDALRLGQPVEAFSMDIKPYRKADSHFLRIAFASPLMLVYLVLGLLLIGVAFVIK